MSIHSSKGTVSPCNCKSNAATFHAGKFLLCEELRDINSQVAIVAGNKGKYEGEGVLEGHIL